MFTIWNIQLALKIDAWETTVLGRIYKQVLLILILVRCSHFAIFWDLQKKPHVGETAKSLGFWSENQAVQMIHHICDIMDMLCVPIEIWLIYFKQKTPEISLNYR